MLGLVRNKSSCSIKLITNGSVCALVVWGNQPPPKIATLVATSTPTPRFTDRLTVERVVVERQPAVDLPGRDDVTEVVITRAFAWSSPAT